MARRDLFLACLIAFVWGLNFVVIQLGIDSFPPLMFSALRFLCAAVPLVFFLPRPTVSWRLILAIGLVLGVVKFALLFIGMDVGLSAGLASLVLQSQVFFTVILAYIVYREQPTPLQIGGIVIAFGGIALVATTVEAEGTLLGLGLVIAAGLTWAIANLLMKEAGPVNMVSLMVWISLIPPLPLILLSFYFEGWEANRAAFANLDLSGIGAVLYIAYLTTILAFAGWGRLIRDYGAGRIAPFSLLVPVFGMISSAVILGEEFGPVQLLAALLVLLGLVLTVIKPAVLRPLLRGKPG